MTDIRQILKTGFITGLLAVMTAGLLSACGGAVEDVTSNGQLTYAGLTTQATLTSDNDDAFGLAMLEGGAEGGAAMDEIPLATSANNNSLQSTAKNQLSAMETMVQEIIANTQQQSTGLSASLTATVVSEGNCGGNIDVSATQSGGSIIFTNYCTTVTFGDQTITTTINGAVTFSLTGDMQSGTYEYTYSYSMMTITIDDGTQTTSHYFSGTITYSVVNYISITVTYSTSFQREGKIYKLEDPSVTGGSPYIDISGKLYHPDYGYVYIETDPAAKFSKVGSQYCGGTLIITTKDSNGATTSSSTMSVDVTCTTYTINYNNEGSSGTIQWP